MNGPMTRRARILALVLATTIGAAACATLQNLIQPPQFSVAPGRQAEFRLVAPSVASPLGGAGIRLWARVQNPNGVGLNLTHVAGNLLLEGVQAADVDLPLGVPLPAQADTVVPLDVTVSFSSLPGLAKVAQHALTASQLSYRLNGKFTVDAGALGPLSFGPSTLLQGHMAVRR